MVPATADGALRPPDRPPSSRARLLRVARYLATTGVLAVGLSALVLPWARELTWWRVLRRCASVAAALALWLFVYRLEGATFRSYGLTLQGGGKRHLVFGVALALAGVALMALAGFLSGAYRLDITPDRVRLWRTVLGFVPAAALVGVLEELVFRGFLLQQLLPVSKTLAVLFSSGLYALVHLRGDPASAATWLEIGGLSLLGFVLAFSVLRTRGLLLAVGLHAVLAYAARVNKLVITIDPSLAWLVGTSRLINGLAIWGLLGAMAVAIAWWARPAGPPPARAGC